MKTEGKSCEEPLVPQLETLPKYRCSGCCSCLWVEVDCPVHNICSSVLVFPTPINKPQPINGLLSFFFSPSAAVSVEACPIWLCKPEGTGSLCCSREVSPVRPFQFSVLSSYRAGSWQEDLRVVATPRWAEWHPKTHETKFQWYCGGIGDSIVLLSDKKIRW